MNDAQAKELCLALMRADTQDKVVRPRRYRRRRAMA